MTAVVRRSHPLNHLLDFHGVFNDFFNDTRQGRLVPPVEVHEESDRYVIQAELPGIKKEDIDIRVNEGVLAIKATKKAEETQKEGQVHFSERSYGEYTRSWRLPDHVDLSKIEAKHTDGVLQLTLHKTEESVPKEIAVAVQ